MEKYLFIAQSGCTDMAKEKEYLEWMDNVHVPDVLATPGIVKAERYVNINSEETKRPKSMIVYEVETEDIKKFEADLHKTLENIGAAGRILKIGVPEKAYPFATPIYQKAKTFKKTPNKK
jgi:hypothetical protein